MIRFAANPIAWSNDDDPTLGAHISLTQCLSEAASIGFDGIEKGHKMPNDVQGLRAALAPHGLALVSGWYSLQLLIRDVAAEQAAIQPHLDLLKAMGCTVCIVCECSNTIHGTDGVSVHDRPVLSAAQWPEFAARVEAIANYTQAQGIDLVYHHHTGTVIQNEDEIDRLMATTGPATRLLLDTGHAYLAGMDPAAMAARYMERIGHLHCKNVRPAVMRRLWDEGLSFLDGVRAGLFTVPVDENGAVRFEPVLREAAQRRYDGWLVIEAEQDASRYDPLAYQALGLAALRNSAQAVGLI